MEAKWKIREERLTCMIGVLYDYAAKFITNPDQIITPENLIHIAWKLQDILSDLPAYSFDLQSSKESVKA